MKYCLCAFLLLLSSISPANEEVPSSEAQPVPELKADTSEAHRQDKTLEINALLHGVGLAKTQEMGLVLGLYVTADSLLELEWGQGREDWNDEFIGGRKRTKFASVYFKKFWGNSFYVRGGLKYVSLDLESGWGYDSDYSFTADRLSTVVAIGNQWQWKNFSWGIDWVTLNAPLFTHFRNEQRTESGAQWSLEYDKERFATEGLISFPNIYVGFSF